MDKKKIDIDKLSLEELRNLDRVLEKESRCGDRACRDCICDQHNFEGRAGKMKYCSSIRAEVKKLIEKLEADGGKKAEEKKPPKAGLPEPPYDIDKLSFPHLLTLADEVNIVQENCSNRCGECISDRHNYIGRAEGNSCIIIQRDINILITKNVIKNRSEIEKAMSGEKSSEKSKEQKPQNCSCSKCKWIDSEMLHKGYYFCLHWHNFTVENGNCYAYESNGVTVETRG